VGNSEKGSTRIQHNTFLEELLKKKTTIFRQRKRTGVENWGEGWEGRELAREQRHSRNGKDGSHKELDSK